MIPLKWVTGMTAGDARHQGLPVAEGIPNLAVLAPVEERCMCDGKPVVACWRDPEPGGRIHGPLLAEDFAKHHDPTAQLVAALAHYLVSKRCAGLTLDEGMLKRAACWHRLWSGRVRDSSDVRQIGVALVEMGARDEIQEALSAVHEDAWAAPPLAATPCNERAG